MSMREEIESYVNEDKHMLINRCRAVEEDREQRKDKKRVDDRRIRKGNKIQRGYKNKSTQFRAKIEKNKYVRKIR